MGAKLSEVENAEFLAFTPDSRPFKVCIGSMIVFLTFDPTQAAWITRVLNAAKSARKSEAMRMLCGQLNLSEDGAESILYSLKASDYESPANWDMSSSVIN